MIKNVRPSTNSRPSSAPPGPLESNWDDEKTVPGLDLDDPLNEFDRVTAIPDLPSEQYVKKVMASAEDSRVPLPGTPPPRPPSAARPQDPIHSLPPDEYFSLDSDPPPSPRSPDSTARYDAVLPHDAPTARPAPFPEPLRPTLPHAPPTEFDLAELDSLSPGPTQGSMSGPVAPRAAPLDLSLDEPPLGEPPPPASFEAVESSGSAIAELKDRYAMGDFSGALEIAERIVQENPADLEAPRYAQSCRDVLTQMYSARLGSLDRNVTVAVPSDQIRWLTLDHRAGFLLSLIDGGITVDQILDISGMPRLDALRIMYQLLDQRVISLDG